MKTLNYSVILLCILLCSQVVAAPSAYCLKQVDKVRIFYINGMFTSFDGYKTNLRAIRNFQDTLLANFESAGTPYGSYNESEPLKEQLREVAWQKYEDMVYNSLLQQLIQSVVSGNLTEVDEESRQVATEFLEDVFYSLNLSIVNETDYQNARTRLYGKLPSCNRFVLLGHSQGNFYTNRLYDETLGHYLYSDEYPMHQYPMMVLASVASPASGFGGSNFPELDALIAHITLDQDLVMRIVRYVFGSVDSNFSFDSVYDKLGHGLVESYLSGGAASQLAAEITQALKNTYPIPLYGQHRVSSSAFDYVGYSSISQVLDVQFDSGRVYRYRDLSPYVWDDFFYSSSLGTYYNEHIRGRYSSTRLE